MSKRTADKPFVSVFSSPAKNVKIEGMVTVLSPMKRGRKSEYFHGEISDGKEKMRLYCYDATVRDELEKVAQSKEGVRLEGCDMTVSRDGSGDLEVYAKDASHNSFGSESSHDVKKMTNKLRKDDAEA